MSNVNMTVKFLLPAIALGLSTIIVLPATAQSSLQGVETLEHLVPEHLARGEADKLNLSADQKAKIKRIREESRDQIQRILTTDQQNQWKAAQQQGKKGREIMRSLNLSDKQKSDIRAIQKATKQRIEEVLTPEQREKMRQRSRAKRNA
jgi:Spy/CpxP family protein refolding chaperone